MIKHYQEKQQLIWMILILLTDCYFLTCTNSYMLFPRFSFLSAQQRSVCCLINEYDDDDDDDDDGSGSECRTAWMAVDGIDNHVTLPSDG